MYSLSGPLYMYNQERGIRIAPHMTWIQERENMHIILSEDGVGDIKIRQGIWGVFYVTTTMGM